MRRSASRCGRSGPADDPVEFVQGDIEVVAGVACAGGVRLAGDVELLGGVLADRLEQLVQAAVTLLQEERLLDEPAVRSATLAEV